MWLFARSAMRSLDLALQLIQTIRRHIRQRLTFGSRPEVFHRVQLRSITWEPFYAQPVAILGQVVGHFLRAMRTQMIPQQHDRAGTLPMQALQVNNHGVVLDALWL